MSQRVCVLLASVSLITFGISANTADKEQHNKIPDKARLILEKAEEIELLSIDPVRPVEKPKNDFHGWKVLGKTVVKDAEARKKLVAAFKKGIAENKGEAALCFNPRHGIRASHDGKTADFLICFECFHGHTYVGEKKMEGFLITNSPEAVFDKVLKDAKVPLAEKPKRK